MWNHNSNLLNYYFNLLLTEKERKSCTNSRINWQNRSKAAVFSFLSLFFCSACRMHTYKYSTHTHTHRICTPIDGKQQEIFTLFSFHFVSCSNGEKEIGALNFISLVVIIYLFSAHFIFIYFICIFIFSMHSFSFLSSGCVF